MSLIQVKLPVGAVVTITAEELAALQESFCNPSPVVAVAKEPTAAAPKPIKAEAEPAKASSKPSREEVIAWAVEQGLDVQRVTKNLVQRYLDAQEASDDEPEADEPEADDDFEEDEDAAPEAVEEDEDDLLAELDADQPEETVTLDDVKASLQKLVRSDKNAARQLIEEFSPTGKLSGLKEHDYAAFKEAVEIAL